MATLELLPRDEQLPQATAFVLAAAQGCSAKTQMALETITEEVFVNIAHYSGATLARLITQTEGRALTLTFEDNGTAYDPLQAKEPDVTLDAEHRPIGGLGIFLVRRLSDGVSYVRTDGLNRLTILKALD